MIAAARSSAAPPSVLELPLAAVLALLVLPLLQEEPAPLYRVCYACEGRGGPRPVLRLELGAGVGQFDWSESLTSELCGVCLGAGRVLRSEPRPRRHVWIFSAGSSARGAHATNNKRKGGTL